MDILPAYMSGVQHGPHACLVSKEAKRGPLAGQILSSELETQRRLC